MKLKPYIPILASLLLFGLFLLLPASWFTGLISNKAVADQRLSLNEQVLKGTLIQNKLFESNHYYPIYGSSELAKDDPFNPGIVMHNHKHVPKLPFLIGTGGSTDLINAVGLASQYDNLKGKKLAFIISPQWFTNHGLTNSNFNARISQTQIDKLFEQPNLSPELKQRYAKRLLQFKHVANKPFLRQVAKNPDNIEHSYVSPFKENQLLKIEAIKSAYPLAPSPLEHVKPINNDNGSWQTMKVDAEEYGGQHTKSNRFGIRDKYWELIKSHKRKINRNYEFNKNSPEFNDLALLVDTMRAAGADVQYVSIPSNGKWYDHIGIDSERRRAVYKKIKHTVTSRDGKLYDMTHKDYEPYVISDAVHIGWKGWVYINQRINHHMHEKPLNTQKERST
ncbi:D-alanyl-lipoteichoic acid biosynthesis protein DltD [Staphylococcus durrellii]|uniref:D-alanyl-lipoteichoic acid biosynthesis protein DltD n=1 Tax=Staphylococcus durrellii TaxID=2781773 RepID=UPI00189DD422|nr:D-alanyl-lipoteichoic acid biosynthesis protein DltD [Staphylococcus durrellii]MBF7017550.1 D-alanyl-lipoteichoic acid biosynthesis protein DltD [Staphylococcus durrellii]